MGSTGVVPVDPPCGDASVVEPLATSISTTLSQLAPAARSPKVTIKPRGCMRGRYIKTRESSFAYKQSNALEPPTPFPWLPDPSPGDVAGIDVVPYPELGFLPNLRVTDIIDNQDGMISVVVVNGGAARSGLSWVDVFFGLNAAPSVGDLGNMYGRVPELEPGEQHVFVAPKQESGWVDAVVDTTEIVDESDEGDNVSSVHMQ